MKLTLVGVTRCLLEEMGQVARCEVGPEDTGHRPAVKRRLREKPGSLFEAKM